MTDGLAHISTGFTALFDLVWIDLGGASIPLPLRFLLCLCGCLIGTLIGVLPGLGPVATVSILLPLTYSLDPVGALVLLSGIYYGAQYGGSTTAILMKIPGEVTSVVTALDGHEMARQGRAGSALGVAAIGSFIAGTIGTLCIVLLSAPLMSAALLMGPAEFCGLILMGLVLAVVLAAGSLTKAFAMVFLGIILSTVGLDAETALPRMTFGFQGLYDGIDFTVLALGLFGFAEILRNLDVTEQRSVMKQPVGSPYPSWRDLKDSMAPILRGTALGAVFGVLPGSGAALGPFASYAVEKRIAKDPSRFGRGAIEGVAGPESANNAGAQTSFIPMLTLGVPPTALMALLLGAMTVQGIVPGPQVMTRNPDLFWGLVVSMWVGNILLLIINLPLIRIWIKMIEVPYRLLYPVVLLVSAIGLFSVANSETTVLLAAVFGLVGYGFIKMGLEPAPLLLGFVLGALLEDNLRRALVFSDGSFAIFFQRPISLTFLVLAVIALLLAVFFGKSRNSLKDD